MGNKRKAASFLNQVVGWGGGIIQGALCILSGSAPSGGRLPAFVIGAVMAIGGIIGVGELSSREQKADLQKEKHVLAFMGSDTLVFSSVSQPFSMAAQPATGGDTVRPVNNSAMTFDL